MKPSAFGLMLVVLGLGACATNQPRSAEYVPPSATLTVENRNQLRGADDYADKYCADFARRAERRDMIEIGTSGRYRVSYECL